MEYLNSIGNGIMSNGQEVYMALMNYLPKIITAIVIALVGYFIAKTLKKITISLSKKFKVDSLISKTNLDEELDDAGIKMKISSFLGDSVKWIVLIITLLIVVDIFKLSTVTDFLTNILGIIGNIIVALFIFAIAVYAARFAGAIAKAVAEYIDIKNTKLVSNLVKAIIYFFALFQILTVLNVEGVLNIIYTFVQAAFYGLALAMGIAFGFGGQEKAKEIIEKCKK